MNQKHAISLLSSCERQGDVEASSSRSGHQTADRSRAIWPIYRFAWRRPTAHHIITEVSVVPCVICYVMVTLGAIAGWAVARCETRWASYGKHPCQRRKEATGRVSFVISILLNAFNPASIPRRDINGDVPL